jgi:hypothetical protein
MRSLCVIVPLSAVLIACDHPKVSLFGDPMGQSDNVATARAGTTALTSATPNRGDRAVSESGGTSGSSVIRQSGVTVQHQPVQGPLSATKPEASGGDAKENKIATSPAVPVHIGQVRPAVSQGGIAGIHQASQAAERAGGSSSQTGAYRSELGGGAAKADKP